MSQTLRVCGSASVYYALTIAGVKGKVYTNHLRIHRQKMPHSGLYLPSQAVLENLLWKGRGGFGEAVVREGPTLLARRGAFDTRPGRCI